MKIGLDGKRAVYNMTGLGNYSRLVIESLSESDPDDSLLVYTPGLKDNPRLKRIEASDNVSYRLPEGLWKKAGPLWRTWGISRQLKADRPDIFHGLSNELPLSIRESGVPSVVTIHDLIYRRMPGCYKPADRLLYDYKYRRSCENADRIIAISRRTADDIMELYGIPGDKIDIVYQGCDDIFREPHDEAKLMKVREKYNLPERYLLQVGTIEERKNLGLSVRALASLPEDLHLVAVGKGKEYLEKIKRLAADTGVEGRVHFLDGVVFADLPSICRQAEVILYPSRYEGFGIPVLEGLESGRPVIAATGSCLEEAGGDAALYVNPDSVREMVEAVKAVLNDSELRQGMITRGYAHAASFSTSRLAESIRAVYEKTISGRRCR